MSPRFDDAREGVKERRWYFFGYIGPAVGVVEEIDGVPMRLADVVVRPTTDEEASTGGLYEGCETVATLTWEPVA